MQTKLEREIYWCTDCRVWDPANQPSVEQQLERDPMAFAGRLLLTIQNGSTLTIPGAGTVPLWTAMLLCVEHTKVVNGSGC